MALPAWRDDYPWLQLAFRQAGPEGKVVAEEWRWRIEDDLKAPLDYQVRSDGSAAVWCGLSHCDFAHEPTPKALLQGLDTAYSEELERRGWPYPDLRAPAGDRGGTATVATRYGPVEIPWAALDSLLEEIRRRQTGDLVVRIFEAVGGSRPVSLDRNGKIVLFDALWAAAERAGGYARLDPQLRALQDRLKEEISEGV